MNLYYRGTNNENEINLIKNKSIMNSLNHITGIREIGLSVSDTMMPIIDYYEYVYTVNGIEIGIGSDGEPLLDIETLGIGE